MPQKIGYPKIIINKATTEYRNVYFSLQNKAGNIWFGTTRDSMYRFDGKLFIQYTVKDGLSQSHIYAILEDKAGNIWFCNTDGISIYDGKHISNIKLPENYTPSSSNDWFYTKTSTKKTVWSLLQDKKGTIWIGTGDGVFCYDGKNYTRF